MNDISAFARSRVRTVMIVCGRKSRSARCLGGPKAERCAARWSCLCLDACRAFSNPATARGRCSRRVSCLFGRGLGHLGLWGLERLGLVVESLLGGRQGLIE